MEVFVKKMKKGKFSKILRQVLDKPWTTRPLINDL